MSATAPVKPDLVTVNIDGKDIAVPRGTNVIEAATLLGIDVPHYPHGALTMNRARLAAMDTMPDDSAPFAP